MGPGHGTGGNRSRRSPLLQPAERAAVSGRGLDTVARRGVIQSRVAPAGSRAGRGTAPAAAVCITVSVSASAAGGTQV